MSTYYTKCGIEFSKSTNAETTGYHIEGDDFAAYDGKCSECPFIIDVKDGCGENATHKRWECRAGSQPPNHVNSYSGNANDKCTLRVYSLDHEFCESVIAFAKDHPELGASYNQDLSDCRRAVSVSCSGNKKGMAAKQELIDKFFPDQKEIADTMVENDDQVCGDCSKYDPPGCEIGRCELNQMTVSAYRPACEDFDPEEPDDEDFDEEELENMDLEDQLDVLLGKADKFIEKVEGIEHRCGSCNYGHWHSGENTYVNVVQDDGIHTVKKPCKAHTHYCYQFAEDQKEIASDENFDPESAPIWCPRTEEKAPKPEKKQPRFNRGGECQEMREDCPCFCAHNDGCAVLLTTGNALEWTLNENNVDCDVFREKKESVIKKPNPVIGTAPSVVDQTTAFDYSEVDHDTAAFLQEKANRITEIRLKSTVTIGRELKEAQDRLANNKTGVFGKWSESIGFKKSTAYNYIRAYEYIVQNLDNIPDLDSIQPSLLLEISKPSAPPELQQAVIDGDITKHKDYVEALDRIKKLNQTENELRKLAADLADDKVTLEHELTEAKKTSKEWHSAYDVQRTANREQRNSSDPGNVQRLVDQQVEANRKIFSLEQEIEKLNEQLNTKPIEASAVEIREVVPEDIGEAWCQNIENAIKLLAGLSEKDMNRIIRILGRENYHYMSSGTFWQNTITASGFLEDLIRSIRSLPAPADEFYKWLDGQNMTS